MRLINTLVRIAFSEPASQKPAPQLVFRLAEAREVKDLRLRRIIELADGKSVEEIFEALYTQELRAGAWEADIGFWRSLFYRDVVETIRELASQGYVQIETPETAAMKG
jgi:hypothetical protein